MNLLQTIISTNTSTDLIIAATILIASIVAAKIIHSRWRDTICEPILGIQTLLDRRQLRGLFLLIISFIPIYGFSFSSSYLELPYWLNRLYYLGSLFLNQIIFILLLEKSILPALKSWLPANPSAINMEGDEETKAIRSNEFYLKRKKLFLFTRIVIVLIAGLIIVMDFDITSNTTWMVYLIVVGLCTAICVRTISDLRSSLTTKPATMQKKVAGVLSSQVENGDLEQQIRISIVELFLKIYSYQLTKQSGTPAKYYHIGPEHHKKGHIYELRVQVNGSWKSRRLTIGRLGANVISRSKCYYVIYDAYLVIKIPPEPITDIKQYIRMLRQETRIASKLSMQECIIPTLSVILRHVHHSFEKDTTVLEEVEDNYLKPLFLFSNLHSFLQLNGSFVFFMDLSKYYFLQNAIEDIHEPKNQSTQNNTANLYSRNDSTFGGNRAHRLGIASNLLNLLALLAKDEVAIRDLKPDNLLIAGDRNKYPGFLSQPASFKIGLIDVETAVIFDKSNRRFIEQPQLGGTDQYATPSHFFDNATLTKLFGGPSPTLHLQDWYAIIAIIYKVISGDSLFEKTAAFIPIIVREISDCLAKGRQTNKPAKELSILFWNQAVTEFENKMTAKKSVLEKMEIPLRQDAYAMIKIPIIKKQLKKYIATQKYFKSEKDQRFLSSASIAQISAEKKKFTTGNVSFSTPVKNGKNKVATLEKINRLKMALEFYKKNTTLPNRSSGKITAYNLLKIMFEEVHGNMCRKEWKQRDSATIGINANNKEIQQQMTTKATRQLHE